ncbi:hypothetical protein FA15DRAFT_660227 [Coprinopsis marcescibilis]|uniref:Uncharacterized protein n=1 Tax=Coprinopsis marcescibilis TaxID=230819 RepID=A0A5C3KG40_COPMA|nr:hypothetical protein FA15DRAFT_660227 [Coprinopsis marcescibilis]
MQNYDPTLTGNKNGEESAAFAKDPAKTVFWEEMIHFGAGDSRVTVYPAAYSLRKSHKPTHQKPTSAGDSRTGLTIVILSTDCCPPGHFEMASTAGHVLTQGLYTGVIMNGVDREAIPGGKDLLLLLTSVVTRIAWDGYATEEICQLYTILPSKKSTYQGRLAGKWKWEWTWRSLSTSRNSPPKVEWNHDPPTSRIEGDGPKGGLVGVLPRTRNPMGLEFPNSISGSRKRAHFALPPNGGPTLWDWILLFRPDCGVIGGGGVWGGLWTQITSAEICRRLPGRVNCKAIPISMQNISTVAYSPYSNEAT